MIRIGRTLPPAAAPIYLRDIVNGLRGLLNGKRETERFRSELKDYFCVKHCFFVSSGKAALTIILKALHELHPERDEVLIPAFICYSVPSAITRAGLKVKLCDVNPDTLDFNYEELKNILFQDSHIASSIQYPVSRHRLLAIIPAHLFGLPADVNRVRGLFRDKKITIIEDAAQALGAKWNGKKLGALGDVGFFSLGRGKALSTVEGGIILTDRDDIADSINSCLSDVADYNASELIQLILKAIVLILFQHPDLFWFPKAIPFLRVGDTFYDPQFKIRKMSALQAGLAKYWKNKLEKLQNNRKENSRLWSSLANVNCLHQYCSKNGNIPDILRFPVRITGHDMLENILKESDNKGHGIMFTYPDSINGIDELREVFKGQTYPVAEKLPQQLLTLPIHPYVSQKDINNISKLLTKAKKSCLQ